MSLQLLNPLSDYLLNRNFSYMNVKLNNLPGNLSYIILNMHEQHSNFSSKLRWCLSQLALDLATEKGASDWLTALPLQEYWFALHKSVFLDANVLCYGWSLLRTPALCGCGYSFSVEHALSCPKGRFPSIRHNEIRDLIAKLLTEVYSQVAVEPEL